MVGIIRFEFWNGIAEAVLEDDGRWSCAAAPSLVRPLDILYSPNWEGVPAGGPAGRRHLEAAARWLGGTVVPGNLLDRGHRCATTPPPERPDRLTDRAAAKKCGVGAEMVRLWVETGAWPIPRRRGGATPTFRLAEVERWIATGTWPSKVHFRFIEPTAQVPSPGKLP